jgi:hypothetical protein
LERRTVLERVDCLLERIGFGTGLPEHDRTWLGRALVELQRPGDDRMPSVCPSSCPPIASPWLLAEAAQLRMSRRRSPSRSVSSGPLAKRPTNSVFLCAKVELHQCLCPANEGAHCAAARLYNYDTTAHPGLTVPRPCWSVEAHDAGLT